MNDLLFLCLCQVEELDNIIMMNPYVNWLLDVAKLVYLVGNYEQTAKLKKLLDSNDPK